MVGLSGLESRLGYAFRDRRLLERALTHRSRSREEGLGAPDNGSLEFLGDAVLGLAVADRLFRDLADSDEGRKSKKRAHLVSKPTLARLGNELALGDHLRLGRGEERSGGRGKPSLIADTFEAVVAAIYLDGGYEQAVTFIMRTYGSALDDLGRAGAQEGAGDHKSALQEWLQARGRALPDYRLAAAAGPDHEKIFTVNVFVDRTLLATGAGPTKKEAERQAAREALAVLTGGAKRE